MSDWQGWFGGEGKVCSYLTSDYDPVSRAISMRQPQLQFEKNALIDGLFVRSARSRWLPCRQGSCKVNEIGIGEANTSRYLALQHDR